MVHWRMARSKRKLLRKLIISMHVSKLLPR